MSKLQITEDAEGENHEQEIEDKHLHEVITNSNTLESVENHELEESIHDFERTEQSSKRLQQPSKERERSRSFISLENSDSESSKADTFTVERIEEDVASNRPMNRNSCKKIAEESISTKDQIIQDVITNDQTEVVTAETDNDDIIQTQSFIITPIDVRAEIVSPCIQRTYQDRAHPSVITQQPRPERSLEATATSVEPAQVIPNPSTDQTQIQPYVQPPSYTSVEINQPNIPFIAPVPPPSYGEAMGIDHLTSPRPPPLILNVATSIWTHRAQPAYCRNCHAVVISRIKHKPCTFTHLAAGLLFLFMCWPFCVLPYCINYCQQARHHCPGCNQVLGVYNPVV